MTNISVPSSPVTYLEEATNKYVKCGEITSIELTETYNGQQLFADIMNRTDANLNGFSTRLPMKVVHNANNEPELLVHIKTSTVYNFSNNSTADIYRYVVTPDLAVNFRLLGKNQMVPVGVTDSSKLHLMLRLRINTPQVPTTIKMTLWDIDNVEIPVRSYKIPGTIIDSNLVRRPASILQNTPYNHDLHKELLYSTPVDADRQFSAYQHRLVPRQSNSALTNFERERIVINYDFINNIVYYIAISQLIDKYRELTGVSKFTPFRMIGRIVTDKLHTRDYQANDITINPVLPHSFLYNYSVGIITSVKDLVVSPDGFTISGKFNDHCTVEVYFNGISLGNVTTNRDGSFTHTTTTNLHYGGSLRLTPNNLSGEHRPSIIQIPDTIAPTHITNGNVTSTNIYGNAEVNSTIKVYDEGTLIITYSVPSTGIVNILLPTPIPDDVETKDFTYTIADNSNNVNIGGILTYTKVDNTQTGDMRTNVSNYTGVNILEFNVTKAGD